MSNHLGGKKTWWWCFRSGFTVNVLERITNDDAWFGEFVGLLEFSTDTAIWGWNAVLERYYYQVNGFYFFFLPRIYIELPPGIINQRGNSKHGTSWQKVFQRQDDVFQALEIVAFVLVHCFYLDPDFTQVTTNLYLAFTFTLRQFISCINRLIGIQEYGKCSSDWKIVICDGFNGLLRGTVKNQDLFIELNELSGQNEHLIAEYEKVMLRSDRFFFF